MDQDPHGSELILLSSIQIRIGNADPVPDSGARKIFHVKVQLFVWAKYWLPGYQIYYDGYGNVVMVNFFNQ